VTVGRRAAPALGRRPRRPRPEGTCRPWPDSAGALAERAAALRAEAARLLRAEEEQAVRIVGLRVEQEGLEVRVAELRGRAAEEEQDAGPRSLPARSVPVGVPAGERAHGVSF
jgi:hypothetical protein